MLLVHRRDVVEPVEVGQRLQVGLVLDQLLGAAVQEPDVGINALDHLAVEIQYQAQDAMRCRVLGPEIDGELAMSSFGHSPHPASMVALFHASVDTRNRRRRTSRRARRFARQPRMDPSIRISAWTRA